MYKSAPALASLDVAAPADMKGVEGLAARGGTPGSEPFVSPVHDYYLTNAIARASVVMAELAALRKSMKEGTTGTHG